MNRTPEGFPIHKREEQSPTESKEPQPTRLNTIFKERTENIVQDVVQRAGEDTEGKTPEQIKEVYDKLVEEGEVDNLIKEGKISEETQREVQLCEALSKINIEDLPPEVKEEAQRVVLKRLNYEKKRLEGILSEVSEEEERKQLTGKIANIENEIYSLMEQIEGKSQKKIKKELDDEISKRVEDLKQSDEYKQKRDELESQLSEIDKTLKELDSQKTNLKKEKGEVEARIEYLKGLSIRTDPEERELTQKREKLKEIENKLEGIENTRKEKEREREEVNQKLSQLDEDIKSKSKKEAFDEMVRNTAQQDAEAEERGINAILSLAQEGGAPSGEEPGREGGEGGPPPEEEREEEAPQAVEVEYQSPWEAFRGEEEFLRKWARITEISGSTINKTDEFLVKELERVRFDFARDWARRHKNEIKNQTGLDYSQLDEKTLVSIVDAMGGFKELRTNEEYKHYNEQIDRLAALRQGWTSEGVRYSVAVASLNVFQKRKEYLSSLIQEKRKETEKARKRLEGLRREESPLYEEVKEMYDTATKELRELEAENEELSLIMEEIAGKMIGRDLREEAISKKLPEVEDLAKKLGTRTGRESYMRELGWSWQIIPGKGKTLIGTLKEKIKGIPQEVREERIVVYDKDGNEIGEFTNEELQQRLFEEVKKRVPQRYIDERVKTLATSPESARRGIQELFERVKKDVLEDFLNEKVKREAKTPEAMEKIKEIAEGRGINVQEALEKTLGRKEAYKGLTGDYLRDKNIIIEDTRRIWGIDLSPERLDKAVEEYLYSPEIAKGNVSFMEWLMKIFFEAFLQKKE